MAKVIYAIATMDTKGAEISYIARLVKAAEAKVVTVDVGAAAGDMDMLTTPYAFNNEEARLMVDAGADLVVAHMGLTTSGTIGARTKKTLDDSVKEVQGIVEACKSIRSDVIVLCHGGPIAMPDDARYILERVDGVDGFYGASSMERLPTETAITGQVRQFTKLKLTHKA